jgi:hypothetical protein
MQGDAGGGELVERTMDGRSWRAERQAVTEWEEAKVLSGDGNGEEARWSEEQKLKPEREMDSI